MSYLNNIKKYATVDFSYVYRNTEYSQCQMNKYKACVKDTEKKKRLSNNLCPICYYTGHWTGGQMFTQNQCGVCEAEMMFGSTCIDVVCPKCAKELGICKHCGTTLNLKLPKKEKFKVAK